MHKFKHDKHIRISKLKNKQQTILEIMIFQNQVRLWILETTQRQQQNIYVGGRKVNYYVMIVLEYDLYVVEVDLTQLV